MRDFKITKEEGEWYYTTVTDSYGNKCKSKTKNLNGFCHNHQPSKD